MDPTLPGKIKGFISIPSFKSLGDKLVKSASNGSILAESRRQNYSRKYIVLDQETAFNPNAKKPFNSTLG